MSKIRIALVAIPVFQFALAAPAFADPAAEKYIDDALPLMYHSCKSVVDEAAGDEAYITKVISALVAVSLYNHEIDISKHVKSEADKTALRDKFVAKLRKECERDNEALLAGAIDDAVVSALSLKK
jgi:hypothetical protein